MDNSVGSAIEKIKLLEQGNDAKLKERREYEATVNSLQRAIRETLQQIEKSDQEEAQLKGKVDTLRSQVILARTRRDALAAQIQACNKELEELRATSNQDIKKVWELRSSLCTSVHEFADEYDIRALLIRPIHRELTPPSKAPVKTAISIDESQISQNETRLKKAIERKDKAISERERLMAEPEIGEEFVRIKNALQYSFQMINKIN